MSFSIYASCFNVQSMTFPWKETIQNWVDFLGHEKNQLVIAVNKSEDDSPKLIRDFLKEIVDPRSQLKIDVLDIDIPYTERDFDGRGKAAALAACTEPFCILMDLDEAFPRGQRQHWGKLAAELERTNLDCFLLPVVDLCGDEQHYREPIGSKFRLHKNNPRFTRGVVKDARREDGTFDTTRSDSTELIWKETGELVRSAPIVMQGLPHFLTMAQIESGMVPFVFHLGWASFEQRLKQSAFWRPVWQAREGSTVKTEETLEELQKIPRFRHALPPWRP